MVDHVNQIVHPTKDLDTVLSKHPAARIFFDKLSFTNKKKYVVWIVDAKKKETRDKRLIAVLEKLASGKRNPSEK